MKLFVNGGQIKLYAFECDLNYVADYGTVGAVGGVWTGALGRHPGGRDRCGDSDCGGNHPS